MRNEWEGQSIFKRYTFWKWTAFFLADADACGSWTAEFKTVAALAGAGCFAETSVWRRMAWLCLEERRDKYGEMLCS